LALFGLIPVLVTLFNFYFNFKMDEKLLNEVKKSLKELSEHEDFKEMSRTEILENFFGVTKWSEVEAMTPVTIRTFMRKVDEVLVPF